MEIQVVSKETIKPSSPTPPNLTTYKISLLDQFIYPIYIPAFLCYQSGTHNNSGGGFAIHEKQLPQLKHAFSETLTRFYPLAGRVRDRLPIIDCNDAGAVFCVTRVKGWRMDELLKQLEAGEIGNIVMNRLIPTQPVAEQEQANDPFQVAVQLNFFHFGGVVLGVLFSHVIIDAITMSCFLKCWAAIYSGNLSGKEWPKYSVSSFYPQRKDLPDSASLSSPLNSVERLLITQAKRGTVPVATKRFLFDAAAITSLKSRCRSTGVENPTSFQALACFIWKHAMAASRAVSG